MVIAAFVGTGAAGGTSVQELQGGALDADGSFLAPGRPAFAIWTRHLRGADRATPCGRRCPSSGRPRVSGRWAGGSRVTMVLNGAWLVTSQFGSLLSHGHRASSLLLAALGWTFHRAVVTKEHQSPWLDAMLIDGVTGLHLGWVSVATVANIAAWLTATGRTAWEARAHLWAIAVLVVVLIIGVAIAWASGWRLTPPFAMAWGCLWIGLGRLGGAAVRRRRRRRGDHRGGAARAGALGRARRHAAAPERRLGRGPDATRPMARRPARTCGRRRAAAARVR